MKKIFAFLVALTLTCSCFAGCSKNPDTASTQSSSTESSNPNNQEPDMTVIVDVPPVNPNGLSLEENGITYQSLAQKAVVKTALAYWARNNRIQYDDTGLNAKNAPRGDGAYLYRWQAGVRKNPEEYTSQYPGYLNCAAFIHDVYWSALNVDIGATYTGTLAAIDDARRVYQYIPTGKETDAEKAAVEQEFYAALQLGDIIVTRAHDNINGHTTLYVGKSTIMDYQGITDDSAAEDYIYDCIHSSGTNYDYSKLKETYEKNGTVEQTSTRHLFNPTSGRYVFTKCKSLTIIRPLNIFEGEVPDHAKNRMLNMEKVIAEKLSSHTAGMTVNPGGEITYTFSITNKNTTPVTLGVGDLVPENTTFVSSENCTQEGNTLIWKVSVPAGETATVSYTVKVNEDVQPGQYIESVGASVGGIGVKCPDIYVGTTLTEAQQAALHSAIAAHADSELRGMALVNALYKDVLGTENLFPDDTGAALNELFRIDAGWFYLNEDGAYKNSIAPGLFGGRNVPQRNKSTTDALQYRRYENRRTRMVRAEELMVGDILIASVNTNGANYKLYLYADNGLLNLTTGEFIPTEEMNTYLDWFLSFNRFAVLRPSLMLDSKQ